MKKYFTTFLVGLSICSFSQSSQSVQSQNEKKDWLVSPFTQKAKIIREGQQIILNNGLVKRVFVIQPNVACIDYSNLSNGQQLLRSIEPEAKVVLDQVTYKVGGLTGQKEKAYLKLETIKDLHKNDSDFVFSKYTIGTIQPFINWKPSTWLPKNYQPTGASIEFEYTSPLVAFKQMIIKVH